MAAIDGLKPSSITSNRAGIFFLAGCYCHRRWAR